MDASPIFEIHQPVLWLTFLKEQHQLRCLQIHNDCIIRKNTKGRKEGVHGTSKTTIEPVFPSENFRKCTVQEEITWPNISSSEPPSFPTTRKQSPPRNSFMMVRRLSSSSLRIADMPLARISPCERCDPSM